MAYTGHFVRMIDYVYDLFAWDLGRSRPHAASFDAPDDRLASCNEDNEMVIDVGVSLASQLERGVDSLDASNRILAQPIFSLAQFDLTLRGGARASRRLALCELQADYDQ